MNSERPNAHHIRDLQRSPERIQQQAGTNAAALPIGVDGKARQHQKWNWMARHALDHALGGVRMTNFAGDDCIKSNNLRTAQPHVGLGRISLLSLECMPNQKTVKLRLSASEMLDSVSTD